VVSTNRRVERLFDQQPYQVAGGKANIRSTEGLTPNVRSWFTGSEQAFA